MTTKKRTLESKTRLYIVLFAVSILLILWIGQILFLQIAYEKYQISTVSKLAKRIENEEITLDELEEVSYENEVCIEVVSQERYSYNDKMIGCHIKDPRIKEDIFSFASNDEKTMELKLTDPVNNMKGILYGVKTTYGSVILYSSLIDMSGANAVLKNQMIYITILVIILAVIISSYIAKILTEPISKMTIKAKKLKNGSFEEEFERSNIKELDELALTLNEAKNDIAKNERLRRDLLANVSHDLKTPLTMIKAYAEMIKDISYKNKKKLDKDADVIISETDRLNNLVNDILDLSKMQSGMIGAINLNIVKYDLKNELDKIIDNYKIMEKTKNYKFILNAPSKIIIKADKDRLNQVILNLLNNAINYTGKDNMVTINVKEEKKSYKIEFVDTGKGIKQEDLPYIWDKYYKNEKGKNHQREFIGSGIGLSIVKEILEKHEFKYGVNSTLNKGTTFYFYINK